jgi:hypothetical protein
LLLELLPERLLTGLLFKPLAALRVSCPATFAT